MLKNLRNFFCWQTDITSDEECNSYYLFGEVGGKKNQIQPLLKIYIYILFTYLSFLEKMTPIRFMMVIACEIL